MAPLVVHAGLHKTGSSLLQLSVFPRLEGVHHADAGAPLFRIVRDLPADGRPAIVSHESLSGDLLAPDYAEQRRASLRNLAALLPQARLLLVLREPSAWVASAYREYLHQGGHLRFEPFAAEFVRGGAVDLRRLVADVAAMGFAATLLLDFDDLADHFAATVDRICGLAGIAPQGRSLTADAGGNRGVRNLGARTLRRANPWLKSRFNRRGLPLTGVLAANFVGTPRRWIQHGPLAFLNRIGTDVIPADAVARLREQWAENWLETKAAMASLEQPGRNP